MQIRSDVFDLWVFHKMDAEVKYLLLHTSQEKADKWFSGSRFWQIPGGFIEKGEQLLDALQKPLKEMNLAPLTLWAVEHTYTIYNRRRNDIEIIPVFAAEVASEGPVSLTWEHSDYGWFTAEECDSRLRFRGLKEGLFWLRQYITENKNPAAEFRLL